MGYVSINRLSLMIQEKISKLNAGNLSMEELDELKELTTELHERVIVLQYKAAEAQLLKQAGDIIQHQEKKEPVQEMSISPIKIELGQVKTAEKPAMEIPAVKIEPVIEKIPEPVVEKQPVQMEAPKIETPKVEIPKVEAPQVTTAEPPAKVSLVERMQKTKISDLKTAIGLNQKFLFMNFLFEGENTSYNDAIEKLNAAPTVADARHLIRELAYVYNWNYEDENVVLFTEYVERRHL